MKLHSAVLSNVTIVCVLSFSPQTVSAFHCPTTSLSQLNVSQLRKTALHSMNEPSTTKEGLKYHFFPGFLTEDENASSINSNDTAVLFCNGFRSSMNGNKAVLLEEHCKSKGIPYCRFDYRGHGLSHPESFLDCTLSDWIKDAETILLDVFLKKHKQVRVLLVGSSMGAWIAVHLALKYPDKIAVIIGIASAIDFTENSLNAKASEEQKSDWNTKGIAYFPSDYEAEPYPITWRLIQDAKENWLLMGASTSSTEIPVHCPMYLLHGQTDKDIPWNVTMELAELVQSNNVIVTLIKDGDHRLSRPQDIRRITEAMDELVQESQNTS
jgi:pimeloyl-ACP methyl ester carboxylesterase